MAPGDAKIIEWNDPDRFMAGIKLLKGKKAEKLVFTGGISPYTKDLPPEGDINYKEAISLGIKENKILTTKSVLNTYEEANAVKEIMKDLNGGISNIILVTSAFHMQRAKKIFERKGLIVDPFPVDFKQNLFYKNSIFNPYNLIPNASNFNKSSNAIREIIGRTYYRTWR